MKIGIAVSGGGVKGATHIGVLRALEENNIKIDIELLKDFFLIVGHKAGKDDIIAGKVCIHLVVKNLYGTGKIGVIVQIVRRLPLRSSFQEVAPMFNAPEIISAFRQVGNFQGNQIDVCSHCPCNLLGCIA